jgi:hypothetical protein
VNYALSSNRVAIHLNIVTYVMQKNLRPGGGLARYFGGTAGVV